MIELKSCPFCGETEPVRLIVSPGKDGWRDRYFVLCNYEDGGCGAESGWYHSQIEAIGAWNRRADMSEWIPVTERLPENQGPFLARYGFGDVSKETGQFFYGVLYYFYADADPHWQHESAGIEITHWMPLPEPPKEET